ncbi:hypothetical protein JCM11491_006291 [Sporobolomyces phaffii]
MVNFALSSRFSFSTTSSASPSTPSSSTISSRSRTHHRLPSNPAPKSPPTTALSILDDLSNSSASYPLARRPAKRPKTSEGFTSFCDLLSIPPSVLDRETDRSEQEREQREQDRRQGKQVAADTPWTAPLTPDPYFLPYRPFPRSHHARSHSDPSPTVATFAESTLCPPSRMSPTRPGFLRTHTDPGCGTPPSESNSDGARRSSTGSPSRFEAV